LILLCFKPHTNSILLYFWAASGGAPPLA
jgi:hypothetical protein